MKKLSSLLVMLMLVQLAFAQGNFSKKIAASDEAIANPKKKDSPKTWVARGELFTQIAEAPAEGVMPGMDDVALGLILKSKPIETKEITLADGTPMTVAVFDNKELYYTNQEGRNILYFHKVTKTEVENSMQKALEAFDQALELDPKPASNKALVGGYNKLASLFKNAATAEYMLGNYELALENFRGELACNTNKAVNMVDTLTTYNVAFLAAALKKYDLAEEYFQKCIEAGYIKDGDMYAHLADALLNNGKEAEGKEVLVSSYKKYPNNQTILVSIINMYMLKGDDPLQALTFIREAQKNEPSNASLFYAEAQLYEKLKKYEEAAKAYETAISKDENNFYSQYGLGYLHYQNAVRYSDEAEKLPYNDEAGYTKFMELITSELKSAIKPLEEAFRINSTEPVVVELLKNVYYRFKDESPEMGAKYEKYDKLLKEMSAN